MYTILVVVLVIISIALMGLIMLQQGKGADAGAAFGTGVSGTMFGSRGGGTFLSHVTAGLATAFFIVTLALAYMANHQTPQSNSVVDRVHAARQSQSNAQSGPVQSGAPASVVPAQATTSGSSAASSPPTTTMKTGAPEASAQGKNAGAATAAATGTATKAHAATTTAGDKKKSSKESGTAAPATTKSGG